MEVRVMPVLEYEVKRGSQSSREEGRRGEAEHKITSRKMKMRYSKEE